MSDEPRGYAVLTADGYFVGIWRDREIAEKVLNRSQQAKNERIVEYMPAAAREQQPEPDVRITDDNALRFACRVLESKAPEEDRRKAREELMEIRTRIRTYAAPPAPDAEDER